MPISLMSFGCRSQPLSARLVSPVWVGGEKGKESFGSFLEPFGALCIILARSGTYCRWLGPSRAFYSGGFLEP